jgi:hypothetical protein
MQQALQDMGFGLILKSIPLDLRLVSMFVQQQTELVCLSITPLIRQEDMV